MTATSPLLADTTVSAENTYVFVDRAYGGAYLRNHAAPWNEPVPTGVADCYKSYQRATRDLVDWVATHTNADGKPTVAGFDGATWCPFLPLDFDSAADPGRAQEWLCRLLERLAIEDVPLDALRYFFSGAKGFAVEIPHSLFGGFEPHADLHVYLKRAARTILGDIEFDRSLYDKLRLWRVANTRNSKSGLFKIQLTPAEVRTLSMSQIYELAQHPRDISNVAELTPVEDQDWATNPYLEIVWADAQIEPTRVVTNVEVGQRGVRLPVGHRAWDFVNHGAPIGKQRELAVVTAVNLLADGYAVDLTTDLVWKGLALSPSNPAKPWTYEHAAKLVSDLAAKRASPLRPAERTQAITANGRAAARSAEPSIPPDPPYEPPEDRNDWQSDEPWQPPQRAPINLSETGNALRLVAEHGRDLRYSYEFGRWLVWDGRRWATDAPEAIEQRVKDVVRRMYERALKLSDPERRDLISWALKSESRARTEATIELARSEPGIPVRTDALDSSPWLLNVDNGTIDLRTGQLREHNRGDLVTKLASVAYDAGATCPIWDAFLERIMDGNQRLIEFLQRAAGYSLTGVTSERVFLLLHGSGANGKTTFLEAIGKILGDGYAKPTRSETLLVKKQDNPIPNDVAALRAARFVWTSETEDGKRLAESLVKSMTGNETMNARFMRAEWFSFQPEFKLWMATNHKPLIRGTDDAIWDRIMLVPFEVRIPLDERDHKLADKLYSERKGILRWMVDGCLEWQRTGLNPPQEVLRANSDYRAEMDTLADFIEDCCVIADNVSVPAGDLWKSFQQWKETNKERSGPINQRSFGLQLEERGFTKGTRNNVRLRLGIGLKAV